MHRCMWAAIAALLVALARPAQAASVHNDAALTLIPDGKGRFSSLRVEENISLASPPTSASTLIQHLNGRRPIHPIVLTSEGLPLPSRFDAGTGELRMDLPAGTEQVVVRFNLPNQVAETRTGSALELGWLTDWQDGVATQKTTLLFPQGFIPRQIRSSWDLVPGGRPVQQVALGVQALEFPAIKPPQQPLTIRFAPKLVSVTTSWWALTASLMILTTFTLWRRSRFVSPRQRADRDPTPTEAAYLYAGEEVAILVSHLDLELRRALVRGGKDFQALQGSAVPESYLQLMLSYYQEPHPIESYFREDNPHRQATLDAVVGSLHAKGLLQDPERARQCGWDLVGYWAVIVTLASLLVALERAWQQSWFVPWLVGWGLINALYLLLPLSLIRATTLTRHGHAKLRKYQALLTQGMHHRDAEHGYRLQLTYGAAFLGIDWLSQSLEDQHVAVYRSVVTMKPERERHAAPRRSVLARS